MFALGTWTCRWTFSHGIPQAPAVTELMLVPKELTVPITVVGIRFAFAASEGNCGIQQEERSTKGRGTFEGIYNVASAMEMAARNQETVSENIANATTPGYRRQGLLFEATSALASQARNDTQTQAQVRGLAAV